MSIVVLISGRGSNLRALVEAGLPVSTVISNVAGAKGLEFARERGIATRVVEHRAYSSRDAFETALAREIDASSPRLVAMAGFMRVLGAGLVERYAGRLLNIHPALLPAFPGLDTHARALAAGVKLHGCTVHFVTPEVDVGPIVIQAALRVRSLDSEESLAARVLELEHIVYPRAVRWFMDGRLLLQNGVVRVRGDDAQLLLAAD
jgi:phosphoribosylglycinamide formyltransferase 1